MLREEDFILASFSSFSSSLKNAHKAISLSTFAESVRIFVSPVNFLSYRSLAD